MKTRNFTLLLSAGLGTVALVSISITLLVLLDNRQLRRELQAVRHESNQAVAETRRLEDERSSFTAQSEQLKTVQAELAALRSSVVSNAPATPVAARAFRAPTYFGQRYLGHAWIVPGQTAKDPATGQVGYEPVILIDESVRGNVAASKTNVVEREVARTTTVNYNYNYTHPNYAWWPAVWIPSSRGGNTPRPPSQPPRFPPPVKRVPQDSGVFLSTKLYQPSAKPFLPSIPR